MADPKDMTDEQLADELVDDAKELRNLCPLDSSGRPFNAGKYIDEAARRLREPDDLLVAAAREAVKHGKNWLAFMQGVHYFEVDGPRTAVSVTFFCGWDFARDWTEKHNKNERKEK